MAKNESRKSGFPVTQQEFLILSSLSTSPKHGYAIHKDVLELTDGKVRFSAATLYENISRLLDAGLIERNGENEIEPGERRKIYRISGKGVTVLQEQWRLLQRVGDLISGPATLGEAC